MRRILLTLHNRLCVCIYRGDEGSCNNYLFMERELSTFVEKAYMSLIYSTVMTWRYSYGQYPYVLYFNVQYFYLTLVNMS